AVDLPIERLEDAFEPRHRENHAVRDVELPVVLIDENTEVVEVLLAGIHHGFPDRTFLQLAVASHGIAVETRRDAACDRETLRDREGLSQGSGWDAAAREQRAGMAVEKALVGARVVQHLGGKIAELSVDRGERGNGMSFAEHE